MNLAEFLTARIDETETYIGGDNGLTADTEILLRWSYEGLDGGPEMILRFLEAARQILALLEVAETHANEVRRTAPEYRLVATALQPRDALMRASMSLAAVWRAHPDYRPEWAP